MLRLLSRGLRTTASFKGFSPLNSLARCMRCLDKGYVTCIKCGGRLYIYNHIIKKNGVVCETLAKCPYCRYGRIRCPGCG
jgi:hypothetical protein